MALRKDIRVLVVDDMSVSRQILLQMLEVIGIQNVRGASDGRAACSSLAAEPAELVIADLNMPGMDGLELLKKLREDRRFFRVGFVMTSGDDTDPRIDDAWRCGMSRFLSKPFDIKKLMNCLESAAGRI